MAALSRRTDARVGTGHRRKEPFSDSQMLAPTRSELVCQLEQMCFSQYL